MKVRPISVIVTAYKADAFIHRCIDSILSQSFPDFELIIVDDGSPDCAGEICDDYARQDARIQVIHKKNGGVSTARNTGLDCAMLHRGIEWISFIDSDDYICPQYLQVLYSMVKQYSVKVAMTTHCYVGATKTIEHKGEAPIEETLVLPPDELFNDDLFRNQHITFAAPWSKLYHKSLFHNIRYPVGKIYEDRFTTHQLLFQCDRVAVTTNPLYMYYMTDESITRGKWYPKLMDGFEAFEEQLRFFRAGGHPTAYRYTCKRYLIDLNYQMNRIKNDLNYKEYYSSMRKRVREILREAHRLGLVGSIIQEPDIYCNAYPVLYTLFAVRRNVCRLIESKETRAFYLKKITKYIGGKDDD